MHVEVNEIQMRTKFGKHGYLVSEMLLPFKFDQIFLSDHEL